MNDYNNENEIKTKLENEIKIEMVRLRAFE